MRRWLRRADLMIGVIFGLCLIVVGLGLIVVALEV
jgi:hypothetical protein